MQGQHDRITIGLHCANKKYDYCSSKITFNNGPCETTFGCEVQHDNSVFAKFANDWGTLWQLLIVTSIGHK